MLKFKTNTPEETILVGEKVGKAIKDQRVIAFYGDLGAGKTTFIGGIAKGMKLECNVSSPTFAIVNVYGENNELCHFDMYRVSTWDDLYSSGFFDYIDNGSVLCVEWSENIENALPEDAIRVEIKKGEYDNERIIEIDGVKNEDFIS